MISVDEFLQKHNEYVVSMVDDAHDLGLLPGYDEMKSSSVAENEAYHKMLAELSEPLDVNIFDLCEG